MENAEALTSLTVQLKELIEILRKQAENQDNQLGKQPVKQPAKQQTKQQAKQPGKSQVIPIERRTRE